MKKKHVIKIDFLGGNNNAKLTDALMHACDMFEPGKVFATHERYVVEGDPDLDKLAENLKNSFEKAGGHVVFVAIREIDGKRCKKPRAWFKNGIQSISSINQNSGKLGWSLFKDILEQLEYKVKTDEHMRVTSITY